MQIFDASSMIYAWDNYPIRQFPPLWEWIATQIEEKELLMPSVAFDEVEAKSPDCGEWLKNNNLVQVRPNDMIMQDSMRIKKLLDIVDDNYSPRSLAEKSSIYAG